MQEPAIGDQYSLSGMTVEILADLGDQWDTRNLTTGDKAPFDKAMLSRAIRLGIAEKIDRRQAAR